MADRDPVLPSMFEIQVEAMDIAPRDPHVPEVEKKRLTGQNAAILARLKTGLVSNTELATMALKYTSRLSDIRAAGHRVRVTHRDHLTGVVWYGLDLT